MARCEQDRISAVGCVMPAEVSAVPLLRRYACGVVRHWRLPDSVEEAVGVVVTELATNVVLHSGSRDIVVRLSCGAGRLVLQVEDSGRWRPRAADCEQGNPERGEEACSGRGLGLVSAFTAHCAVVVTRLGTRVTAELLLPERIEQVERVERVEQIERRDPLIMVRSNGSV